MKRPCIAGFRGRGMLTFPIVIYFGDSDPLCLYTYSYSFFYFATLNAMPVWSCSWFPQHLA